MTITPRDGWKSDVIDALSRRRVVYWCSIPPRLRENYHVAMLRTTWGVREPAAHKMQMVNPSDLLLFNGQGLGFTICKVTSKPFRSEEVIWRTDLYPWRVRISPALAVYDKDFSAIWKGFRKSDGKRFETVKQAAWYLKDDGGVLRKLELTEVQDIFTRLDWSHPNVEIESEEFAQSTPQSPRSGAEKAIQDHLVANLADVEPGLKLVKAEYSTSGGRIDILAEDQDSNLCAIELKAGIAEDDAVGQVLRYMGSLTMEFPERGIRGILVAAGFAPGIQFVPTAVPNLLLRTFAKTIEDT